MATVLFSTFSHTTLSTTSTSSSPTTTLTTSRTSLSSKATTSTHHSSSSIPKSVPSASSSSKPNPSPFGRLSVGAFVGIIIAVVIVIGLILMVLTSLRRRHRKARRQPRGIVTSTYIPPDSYEAPEAQNRAMLFAPVGAKGAVTNTEGHYAAIPSMSSNNASMAHLYPGYANSWQGLPDHSGTMGYRDSWRSSHVPSASIEYAHSYSSPGIQGTASQPANESWEALPSPHDSPYLGPRQLPPISELGLRGGPDQHGFLPQASEAGQTR